MVQIYVMKYIFQQVKIEQIVCCLSSLNLELYDDWRDTDVVKDLITFLDNVLQFFIDHVPDYISRDKIFYSTQERSLGLGAMGLHSLYQKHRLFF